MTHSQPQITATTHALPFDKLSPRDFERLCLWLVEREGYERAEHLGAAGSEQSRDITAPDGVLTQQIVVFPIYLPLILRNDRISKDDWTWPEALAMLQAVVEAG